MSFSNILLKWYDKQNIKFPWRNISNPYHIWVSEIMLQQTQVKTVIPYFEKWIKNFPTIESVANANDEEIFKNWEGLGYYKRALNLRQACIEIMNNEGLLYSTSDQLIKLKGIGDYTASAIASIAFNEVTPAVDGNVKRIMSRLLCIDQTKAKSNIKIKEILNKNISQMRPGDFNQALMDLGRTICIPKNPNCISCPINSICKAYKTEKVECYPIKSNKIKKLPHHNIGVGIVWNKNKLLITKRKKNQLLGGLWEFPGGKVKNNESIKNCIKREIKEELDIQVSVKSYITKVKHQYSHFKITLYVYNCTFISGELKCVEVDDWKWINTSEFDKYPFPKANHHIFPKLQNKEFSC